jgi:hypothetical protein
LRARFGIILGGSLYTEKCPILHKKSFQEIYKGHDGKIGRPGKGKSCNWPEKDLFHKSHPPKMMSIININLKILRRFSFIVKRM